MPRPADPRKQQYWLQHIQRWQDSNLSVRDYCERLQLSEASFYSWKRTLQQRGLLTYTVPSDARSPRAPSPDALRFVPVTVSELVSTAGRIEPVLPDGCIVRLMAGFDAQSLRQLLAVLRERPC